MPRCRKTRSGSLLLVLASIGLDLVVVALVAALAVVLWGRHGPGPLTVYFAGSYVAGLVLTIPAQLL